MTRGWLDSDANPLAEYKKTADRLGEDKAAFVMDIQYKNYSRLMFVAHAEEDFKAYQSKIQPVVEFCSQWDMEYEEYLGDLEYIRKLIANADQTELGKLTSSEEFIVVPPGGEINQMDFISW